MSRWGLATIILASYLASMVGCRPPAVPKPVPPARVSIQSTAPIAGTSTLIVPDQPVLPTQFSFDGATGNVRLTVEVDGGAGPVTLNDVLFRAEGSGTIILTLLKPGPDRKVGQLTVQCRSGGEESSADLDAGPWFADADALVGVESKLTSTPTTIIEGTEVVLARYSAIGASRTVRMAWKAVFSKQPTPPRVKAGMKPPR